MCKLNSARIAHLWSYFTILACSSLLHSPQGTGPPLKLSSRHPSLIFLLNSPCAIASGLWTSYISPWIQLVLRLSKHTLPFSPGEGVFVSVTILILLTMARGGGGLCACMRPRNYWWECFQLTCGLKSPRRCG